MASFIAWITYSIVYATVIMLGATGETLTEKAGHLNLGVPGIMTISGFVGYYVSYLYEQSTVNPSAFVVVILSLSVSFGVGAIFGLIYSLMCVTFKCNQNIMGLIITSFAVGFSKFLSSLAGITTGASAAFSGKVYNASISALANIPVIGPLIFGYGFTTYLAIVICILLHIFLKKTRTGLNLRSVGESPASADAVGINTTKYKYIATIVGCGISGLGGISYVLGYGSGLWSTNNNIEAIGWLAVALVIFASWHPLRLIYGSIIFGILFWTYNYITSIINIPTFNGYQEIIKMLPYVITIIVLIINSAKKKKENQPPMSLGTSYYREER